MWTLHGEVKLRKKDSEFRSEKDDEPHPREKKKHLAKTIPIKQKYPNSELPESPSLRKGNRKWGGEGGGWGHLFV